MRPVFPEDAAAEIIPLSRQTAALNGDQGSTDVIDHQCGRNGRGYQPDRLLPGHDPAGTPHLLACATGWALDGMDFMIYPLVIGTIIKLWNVDAWAPPASRPAP